MNYPSHYQNDDNAQQENLKDLSLINQSAGGIEFINTQGEEQLTVFHKSGSFARYDKKGKEELVVRDKREFTNNRKLEQVGGDSVELLDQNFETIVLGDRMIKIGDLDKWIPYGEKYKKALQEYHSLVQLFETKRTAAQNEIDQSSLQTKSGSHAACPSDSQINKTLKTKKGSTKKEATKSANGRTIPEVTKGEDEYADVSPGKNGCFTCGGTGKSPSTQDGNFVLENLKNSIESKRAELQKIIYDYEKEVGQNKCPSGGNVIENIAKDKIETIGLVFNDAASFRKDPVGKLVASGVKIQTDGKCLYTEYEESPLVEVVQTEKLLGGSYNLVAGNNLTINVGSQGFDLRSTGPGFIFGTLMNIVGEQTTIQAASELSLEAKRIDLNADIITIRPISHKKSSGETSQQLFIDGNLNVGLNGVIRGGLHVEGELSFHHASTPFEYHITEADFEYGKQQEPKVLIPREACNGEVEPPMGQNGVLVAPGEGNENAEKGPTYGDLIAGSKIGVAVGQDSNGDTHCLDVYALDAPNAIRVHPHYHLFKSIPVKFFEGDSSHDDVRKVGARNNYPVPVLARSIEDSASQNTSQKKFNEPVQKDKWGTDNKKPSRPVNAEGEESDKYSPEQIENMIQQMNQKLDNQYKENKRRLASLASNFNLSLDIDNSSEIISVNQNNSGCL